MPLLSTPRPALLRSLLAAATLATLSACAMQPKTIAPLQPDAATREIPTLATSRSADLRTDLAIDRWWQHFGDTQLDAYVAEALAHNADLEAAAARVRQARAQLDLASAALYPSLDLQLDSGRQQGSLASGATLPGAGRQTSRHVAQLTTSYEIDLWGKLSSTTAAARQQVLASQWSRATLAWSLSASVAETYFALAAVDRQIAISEAVRDSRRTTVQLRQREYGSGTGNEFDLRRAEAELTSTESNLASLQRTRVSLESSLTLLLGRSPRQIAEATLARNVLDEGKRLTNVLPAGEAAQLLVRRPDIRQVEAQLAAANANVAAARAATLPSLRLTGAVGSDARRVSDLFSGPAFIWSIAAGLTQSIFDGGRNEANVRLERARGEELLANYRQIVAAAVLDVREAYAALDIAEQGLAAERARVNALGRARSLAQLGYAHGAFGYLDLLDAERNWYHAQLQQVSAYRDQLNAQIAAFKSLGGGYDTDCALAPCRPRASGDPAT